MSQPGWYPDPGGQAGTFRYWDGRSWSAQTTNDPRSAAPPGGAGQPTPAGYGQGYESYGQQGYGQQQRYGPQPGGAQAYAGDGRKKGAAWWLIAAVVALVVIVIAFFAVRALIGGGSGIAGPDPNGTSTQEACPPEKPSSETPPAQPNDGRVHGGQLSYPMLGSPWGPPSEENRVPFGRDVLTQIVEVEPNYDGSGSSWVASVLIGELVAGDGFFSPEEGSKIVVECIVGTFYGEAEVTRDDQKNQALKVDGKDAWVVESHLTFDIPDLETKGELLIVVIVATSEASSAIYYASIPDTTPELVQPARDAMADLKVDG